MTVLDLGGGAAEDEEEADEEEEEAEAEEEAEMDGEGGGGEGGTFAVLVPKGGGVDAGAPVFAFEDDKEAPEYENEERK